MDRQQGPTVAQGTLLTVMCPPGWEGGLRGCVWLSPPAIHWNHHNIGERLYPNPR